MEWLNGCVVMCEVRCLPVAVIFVCGVHLFVMLCWRLGAWLGQ